MAALVEEAMVCDDEHPGAKLGLTSGEVRQVPCNLQEDLAGQVFRLGRPAAAEISEDRGGQVAVEGRPCPLGPASGRQQDRG